MWNEQTVQVIFPAFNEEEGIRRAITDFYGTGFVDEVIVVDNKSTDGTREEILATSATYLFEEQPGYGAALTRGLRAATADIIVTCEPDGTFSAKDLLKLLIYSDDYDVVFGTRTSKAAIWSGANMSWLLRIGNVAVAKLLEYLFNGPCLTDVGCTLKLIKRDVLKSFVDRLSVTGSHFQPQFMIMCIRVSQKVIEIPVEYLPRTGVSKITGSLSKAVRLGCTMILFILKTRVQTLFPR
ncbi:glycosyltransferase family 2 protein [Geobacter hydrogenophilus]|uniref:Glycosyl hydrolase n=1 Tax=Geobacter hydrogenophilus TaxID=40983 RepID=A0A9W6LD40_9BACT|nr:glycosyltransferase family 2 protein [Geobacter hydrogenophilus]MBT0894107.1 glycosyltransferase family 2 protein [Geobacter hydrogenophilus]GLI38610.1 glycosyl hydrolase [Geobacter hydrogenophilus]